MVAFGSRLKGPANSTVRAPVLLKTESLERWGGNRKEGIRESWEKKESGKESGGRAHLFGTGSLDVWFPNFFCKKRPDAVTEKVRNTKRTRKSRYGNLAITTAKPIIQIERPMYKRALRSYKQRLQREGRWRRPMKAQRKTKQWLSSGRSSGCVSCGDLCRERTSQEQELFQSCVGSAVMKLDFLFCELFPQWVLFPGYFSLLFSYEEISG